ncbi:MAG: GIY-YIG nuclease family protein [Ignavibacteria bacterium]|nr:GIY-YIG nuclease family protein [Ignavibacteria bacterium]
MLGQANNLESRVRKHNSNKVFSIKNRGTWKLIYFEEFKTRSEAMKYEIE